LTIPQPGGGELSNDLSSNASIVIDDSNFNSYFDSEGYIINSDIEENSTIYFDNISNKNVVIDIPLTVTAFNSNSIILNTTFRITEDGSGSSIKNLVFNNVAGSEAATPILIDESSNNVISNNVILLDFNEDSYYSIAGLYICGESLNNTVSYNRISINSKNKNSKHYAYGIELSAMLFASTTFSKSSPSSNNILGNMIQVSGDHYSNGIYSSNAFNNTIVNNDIVLDSASFAYGIITEFFDAAGDYYITISDNRVTAHSSMIYLVETFRASNVNVSSNSLTGVGDAVYGIAAYESDCFTVYNNDILVNGSDLSKVGENFDAITSGHSGIYFMKDSLDINVSHNRILSYYTKGGDYAIRFDSTSYNVTVNDNNLTSNNYTYSGDSAIYGNVYCFNNSAYLDEGMMIPEIDYSNYTVVDVYVSKSGSDSNNGSFGSPFLTINKAITYLRSLSGIKGIVHLANGTYSSAGFNTRIYINELFVDIVGDDATIIDGESVSWFFDISKTSCVTINNIRFKNGVFRQSNGGVIFNKGDLRITDCVFEKIKVTDSSALVYNEGKLDLSNNILNLNVGGAAIYNNKILSLTNNTINLLYDDSKAILNDGYIDNLILDILPEYENHTLLIDNYFIELSAFLHDDNGNPISGGDIVFSIESKEFHEKLSVDDGHVNFNITSALKGTVKVLAKYLNAYTNIFVNIGYIKSSTLSDGIIFYVSENGDDINGDGSLNNPFKTINKVFSLPSTLDSVMLYLNYSQYKNSLSDFHIPSLSIVSLNKTEILTDWNFNAEANIKLANLIFNGSSVINKYSNLNIDSCSFVNSKNTAVRSEYGNLTISNSNFYDNFVKLMHSINDRGGAINNAYGDLTILRSNFMNNNAFYGGAIYNNQSNLYISDCNFINNLAFGGYYENVEFSFGGAISQWLGKEVFISDCLFLNNTANGYGGAFFSFGLSNYLFTSQGGWVFYDLGNNNVFRLWGKVFDSPQDIYFINCIFDSNVAPYAGGAVYIRNNSHTEYINCHFLNNAAFTYDVEKLFAYSVDRYYMLVHPNRYGQNWYYKDQMGSVTDMLFVKNDLGGAIYDENLHLSNVEFAGNTLDSGGSVLLPSIYSNPRELNHVSNTNIGLSQITSTGDSVKFVVEDSNTLTGSDAQFLGIGGWKSNYNGPSINRNIEELNNQPHHGDSGDSGDSDDSGDSSGSGNSIIYGGSGNSGNGDGDNSGSGSSTGEEGSGNTDSSQSGNVKVSLSDIYNYFASSLDKLVINNGNAVTLDDIKDMLNAKSSDNSDDSDPIDNPVSNSSENSESIDDPILDVPEPIDNPVSNSSNVPKPIDSPVTNSSDISNPIDDSNVIQTNNSDNDGHIENNGEVVDVGLTDVILTGQSDEGVADSQSEEAPEQSEPDASNSQNDESKSDMAAASSTVGDESASSHEINKVSKEIGKDDYSLIYAILFVILVIFLIVIGYYKNKHDGDEY